MDRKKFYEVFPDIVLEDDYSDIFNHVDVVKILKRENNSELVVCIEADRLIDKMSIYRAEEVLREHLFGSKSRINVRFSERYLLSGQYNLKNLVDIYYDSFLLEIGKKSSFDQQQMRKKDYTVSDNDIVFNVADSFVMRGRIENLKAYFEKTFLERFGMNVNVSFAFVDDGKNAAKKPEVTGKAMGEAVKEKEEEEEGGFIIGPEMNDFAFVVGDDTILPFGNAEVDSYYDKMAAMYGFSVAGATGKSAAGNRTKADNTAADSGSDAGLEIADRDNNSDIDAYYDRMMDEEYLMNEYQDGNYSEDSFVHHERYNDGTGSGSQSDGDGGNGQNGVGQNGNGQGLVQAESAGNKAASAGADGAKAGVQNADKSGEKADDKKDKKKPGTGKEYAGARRGGKTNRSSDPECFYGRNCDGDITEIKNLEDNMGEVCIRGQVLGM